MFLLLILSDQPWLERPLIAELRQVCFIISNYRRGWNLPMDWKRVEGERRSQRRRIHEQKKGVRGFWAVTKQQDSRGGEAVVPKECSSK